MYANNNFLLQLGQAIADDEFHAYKHLMKYAS